MSTRLLLLSVLAALLSAPLAAPGQSAAAAAKSPATPAAAPTPDPAPARSRLMVPVNTTIPLELKNSLSSRTAYVGQAIYCETIYPITIGNRIVIPAGSYVKGAVTQVVRPGRVKGRAQIGLRFESLTLPEGTTRPLRATLSGFAGNGKEGFHRDESKIEGESTKGEDAAKVAQTTVTGAEIGTIAGVAKRRVGTGLGVGSAVGAAGGLIWVLATRGKDVLLPSGTSLELQLSAPLSLDSDDVGPLSPYQEGPALPHREPGPGI